MLEKNLKKKRILHRVERCGHSDTFAGELTGFFEVTVHENTSRAGLTTEFLLILLGGPTGRILLYNKYLLDIRVRTLTPLKVNQKDEIFKKNPEIFKKAIFV